MNNIPEYAVFDIDNLEQISSILSLQDALVKAQRFSIGYCGVWRLWKSKPVELLAVYQDGEEVPMPHLAERIEDQVSID